ncbi:hypothetical protein MON38_14205 [Hymenobacter sp. DH14]|uniref:Outer membrane protein beta-barrel domain-containing protein n=1 Tax=Hymenobacter cyanobacteriorum TaxID=2926463 RepID=A0A9X1VH48_9BACT|nr:hypothetical protein [Hymenobacter cyanobacteriorum]MCI1188578.1 hypothetical protein [Hymenobacter cyanobacteriorum]
MKTILRFAPLALFALPGFSYAQTRAGSAVGLEFPAPAPPAKGHFLTGTYVVGAYSPLATASGYGYGVQPYLRYQFGSSATGRLRPFVQYSFVSYRLPAYGTGLGYGPESTGLPANAAFAPLAARSMPSGYGPYGSYGGLGAFSVGIPMQLGRGTAVLNIGGALLESAFMQSLHPW